MSLDDQAAAELDAAPLPRQWPYTMKLQHPVTFGELTIAELTFQRGKLAAIRGLKLSTEVPVNDLVTVASRLCAQPPKLIEMLDVDDAQEVMSIALDFYGKCLSGMRR